jgi:hypothetical protein
MVFKYDSTGIDLNAKSFPLIPDGWWPFRIMETESMTAKKSGYPMVLAKCKCIDLLHSDKGLIFHYVTFIPKGQKGDGINVHFRKSIGVPWEGDVVVDPEEWVGKTFMGKVVSEEYDGKTKNKFKEIAPIKKTVEDSEIPF